MLLFLKQNSLLEPTSVRIPRLARLFVAKETPTTVSTKEDPNKYRQEHGKCPKGYHVDEETGKCITNEELMEKLRRRVEEGKQEEEETAKKQKSEDYKKGVPSIRKRDPGDEGFDDVLDQVQSSYGVMKHIPKGLRKAVKYPFKFLAERFNKGSQKWSDAVKKEEETLRQAHENNPFLRGEKMSPEEEDKAAKEMFSGAGRRWGRAIAKVGGKAFKWASNPKEAVSDIGKGFVGAMKFIGRRTGDAAEIIGHIVGEHKAAGRVLAKMASGRFHEVTKTEKHAIAKVALEGAEIFVLGSLMKHVGHGAHGGAHSAVIDHASEGAESMSDSMVDHLGHASEEALTGESRMAAMEEFAGEAFGEYMMKLRMGGSIKLIDEIANGIVHGEHHEDGKKRHAGVKLAKKDEKKAVAAYLGRKVLEDFLDKSKDYKPSPKAALRAMKAVGDMATLSRLAKMEAQGDETEAGESDLSKGIIQKVEKTSSRVTPSEKNWYDYGFMKNIASRFRKALRKLVGELYEHTWMNSPPHHDKEDLRNFGDVVSELKSGYEKDPKWEAVKDEVESLIAEFEKNYPGVTFSITSHGQGKNLISSHSHVFHYPENEGTLYVYRVDDISSWW